jgi:Zn-dependent M28 family amino/carboxypeptidase
LHVTGEEHGLLGSSYYSANPLFPMENTITDINIDMIGRRDRAHANSNNYVYVIGADRLSTDLNNITTDANKKYVQMELDYKYNDLADLITFMSVLIIITLQNMVFLPFYFNGVHADTIKNRYSDKIEYDALPRGSTCFTMAELANRKTDLL